MNRRNLTTPALACLFLLGCGAKYGIPVQLGWSSDQVRNVLGAPESRNPIPGQPDDAVESYSSSGIIARYSRDRLSFITFQPDGGNTGFLPYTGAIINDVRITDNKATVLRKLGTPTKIERDELPSGVNPDVPTVWPKADIYYWRLPNFTVVAIFLNQAQSVSDEKHIVWAKDTLTLLTVQK